MSSSEPSAREQVGRAALVADLLTAQSNHISSLKWAVGILEGKISLRNSLAEVQAEALRTPFRDVMGALNRLKDTVEKSHDEAVRKLGREVNESLDQVRRALLSIGDWLSASTDPTILYPREALQRVPLDEILERTYVEMGSSFDRKRLIVKGVEGITVTTAPARLSAIITALLENALRHGGPGSIELDCSVSVQQ
ncbi:MAG: HAMP domain-containing histidine kinase, partial [Acidimicrobiales bacterium]|nr:HAMP domain-containing histidine kinase [Acidimicrobiales bacterium]